MILTLDAIGPLADMFLLLQIFQSCGAARLGGARGKRGVELTPEFLDFSSSSSASASDPHQDMRMTTLVHDIKTKVATNGEK